LARLNQSMKNNKLTALQALTCLLIFSLCFIACSKPTDEIKENRPPGSFTVTVSNVTFNTAVLNWTAATDPENEAVTYTINLDGQAIAANLATTAQNLTSLLKNKAYTGTVIAADATGNKTTVNFSFNTSDSPPPSDFTVQLTASTNKSLSLSWTASTLPGNETVKYDVYAGSTLKVVDLTQTSYTINGLTPGTAYQLKVVAKSPDGKSTEKTLAGQTAANAAPATFTAQTPEQGFSYIKLTWNASTDSDGDSLSYFLNRNGILTALTDAPVGGVYTSYVRNLSPSTAYSYSIVAKDAFGGEAQSNTVQATTKAGPENNFLFTAKNEGSDVKLEWIQDYATPFDVAASSYVIGGVEKSLSLVQVSTQVITGNKLYVQIIIPGTEFPANVARDIKLKLNWGANETITQSRTINHTRYTLTATTATVTSAILKTFGNGDRGYTLKFANDIVSDYTTWQVIEVKFENSIQPGSVSTQFPSGQTVSSIFGGLSETDYQYLKTKSEGYIVVQDSGGFHRLNFTYTVQ
jgi:hypothetical protein